MLSSALVALGSWWRIIDALPTAKTPSLLDSSIAELGALLDSGSFNSYDLVELYIQRADEVNDELNAVIEINPDALSIAQGLDRERADGKSRGPLHGIPILVKDNFATVDAMLTGSGSVCLARALPTKEATVVAKLREAGAIILGKLNLSEFAGVRNATPGWSPRGGQTFGAYVKHQTACGSSSGSGVAAAVGLAAGTLGTETSGSITCPAMYNNVVGVKPTVGLTSRFGVVPITARQDTTGPITQNVEDAAILLEAIASKDQNDNYTSAQPWDSPPRFSTGLSPSGLKGARIGVVWTDDLPVSANQINIEQVKPVFDRAIANMEAAGAEVIDVTLDTKGKSFLELLQTLGSNVQIFTSADFNEGIKRYLDNVKQTQGIALHNVSDISQCLKTEPRELASTFDLADWEYLTQLNVTADSFEAWNAYVEVLTLTRGLILDPIDEHGLDALVMLPDLALVVGATPGFPIVTIPMGALGPEAETTWDPRNVTVTTGPGIPLGISFTADQWSDHKLIKYAYAFEQASQRRRELTPIIKPISDLATVVNRRSINEI